MAEGSTRGVKNWESSPREIGSLLWVLRFQALESSVTYAFFLLLKRHGKGERDRRIGVREKARN